MNIKLTKKTPAMFKIVPQIIFITLAVFYSCKDNKTSETNIEIISSNKDKKVVTLQWLGHWYGEGKKETFIHEIGREFSFLNQDIILDLKFPHEVYPHNDASELFIIGYQELTKMAQTNAWPFDILLCDQERYVFTGRMLNDPQWGKKHLVDFSQEPWFKEVHKEGIFDSGEVLEKYGGIIPGPIIEGITNIMYVSEEAEKKLGIKVKKLDMQFSDLLSYAQAVHTYNQNHTEKISLLSTQYNLAITTLLSQLVQSEYGKTSFSSKKESLEIMKRVYEKLEQLAQYKPIEQHVSFGNLAYDAQQRILRQDKFLFVTQPSWMFLLWNNSNPEGTKLMKPCEIPSMDGKIAPNYSGFYQIIFVVPKSSPNVEEAKRFIKYISSEQIAETWIKYAKCPTGLKTKISYSDFGQEDFELFYRHLQKKYGNNQKDVSISKLMFNTTTTLNFNTENILNGTMKASEALRNLEKQIN